jgi:hypothetical protein
MEGDSELLKSKISENLEKLINEYKENDNFDLLHVV